MSLCNIVSTYRACRAPLFLVAAAKAHFQGFASRAKVQCATVWKILLALLSNNFRDVVQKKIKFPLHALSCSSNNNSFCTLAFAPNRSTLSTLDIGVLFNSINTALFRAVDGLGSVCSARSHQSLFQRCEQSEMVKQFMILTGHAPSHVY